MAPAPEDGYRSPAVQSAADSFDLHRDEHEADYYARSRARGDSNTRAGGAYRSAPPVDDAVNNAFERSDAASQVDPGLVAQITEQVINTLKASGITGVQQPPPQPAQAAPASPGHSRSPTDSAAALLPRRYTPPSPTRHETASYRSSSPGSQLSEAASYSSVYDMPRPKRSSSNASPARASEDTRPRPRQVRIPSAVEEASTLEKIWQPLFQSGQPTPRLSQFLRGLALHIINDYEPKYSLVISPAKMVRFFEDVKLSNEIYPWRDIFGGRITNESISRIYRDLRCQHHFIQLGTYCVPEIPALTPDGFDCFMTTLIQAHPSMEFERLAKAVLDMPISNADDTKERFPKELSRRLFPPEDDIQQQQRLHAAISTDRNIQLRSSNPMPPPPPPQTAPPPFSQPFFTERERAPYSSFSSAVDDDDLRTAPVQIERERKPYTAKEGSGKIFEDDRKAPARADPMTRPSRANSAAPTQPFIQSKPTDIPATGQRHHRLSATNGQRPNFLGTPPSAAYNPYTRSEGTNLGDIPSGYYASNLHAEDDRSRYARRDEDNRRASWYPPRGGYEYPASGYDDRRRTGGGTDGYGGYNGYPSTSKY